MYYTLSNPIEQRRPGNRAAFYMLAVLFGFAFLLTEHRLMSSAMEAFGTTTESLESAAEGGHLKNQVGYSLVALAGLGLFLCRSERRLSTLDAHGFVILAYLAICLASVLWSVSPWVSMRRLIVMLFCFMGAVGAAKHFTAHDLCRMTLIATLAYVLIGVGVEVALGTFTPWAEDYRFAGTMHPNGQGDNCACLCLAAVATFAGAKRGKPILIAIIVFGAVLLLLTKSRTATVSLLGALLAYYSLRIPFRIKVYSGLAVGWATCLFLLFVHLLGAENQTLAAVTMGRPEHLLTLTGRTELWQVLVGYVIQRPLFGYGYGAFWTPDQVQEISSTLFWGVSSAHSTYLKVTLDVGLVGVTFAVLSVFAGIWRAASQSRVPGNAAFGFVFALLVFAAVNGVAESGFAAPSFLGWVGGCGIMQLAFFRQRSNSQDGNA